MKTYLKRLWNAILGKDYLITSYMNFDYQMLKHIESFLDNYYFKHITEYDNFWEELEYLSTLIKQRENELDIIDRITTVKERDEHIKEHFKTEDKIGNLIGKHFFKLWL